MSGSALFPFVRYLSRAICCLLKQVLIIFSQPAVLTVRTYVRAHAILTHMNVDHVLLGHGLSSINYASLYSCRSHLNLTNLNLTDASPTAKPPNLIDCQYFQLYGNCFLHSKDKWSRRTALVNIQAIALFACLSPLPVT